MNCKETESKINIKAWKDPAFKKKLLNDPQAVLKELGMKNLPSSVKVRIVEEGKNEWCITLHAAPPNAAKMSEEELEKWNAAGGYAGWECASPGPCSR